MASPPPPPFSRRPISISPSDANLDKSTRTRSYVLYSFWLVVLLSVPYFWISTSIQRLPLPPLENGVSDRLRELRFRDEVVLTVASGSGADGVRLEEVALQANECLQQAFEGVSRDEIIVRAGASDPSPSSRIGSHNIQLLLQPSSFTSITSIFLPPSSESSASFLQISLSLLSLPDLPQYISETLTSHLPSSSSLDHKSADSLPSSSGRAAKFAPHYRLAFTLLLEDVTASSGGRVGWEIERGLSLIFKPYLSSLSLLYNFTLESQIHYSSPLSITPLLAYSSTSPSSHQPGYIVPYSSTKAFVNPSAWTLGSHSTLDTESSPTLQFMIFMPKTGRRPLSFELAEGEGMGDRNEVGGSFLIPQSGSLTLFNPTVHIEASGDKTTDPEYLSLPRLIPLLQTHLQNLQTLLGVPPSPSTSSISASPSSSFDGLTTFQLSTLLKRRTLENVNAALGGVEALGRLVKQNGEMRIGEKVQKDYLEAVAHLKEIVRSPTISPLEAFQYSASALELSSSAFFNPSMLGLLYFPDEHKYAVYTPLFAPVAVPMVVGLVKEVKRRARERKERKKKLQLQKNEAERMREAAGQERGTKEGDKFNPRS